MSMKSESIPSGMLAGLFFSSASTIAFEITLTRVFSISLWHHFASMVISIGMMGIGLSGTLQSLMPSLRERKRLGIYSLLLGVSIPVGYIVTNLTPLDPARLTWDPGQLLYISLYYLFLGIPFFFFGLIVSISLYSFSDRSGTIYGADLLGAGTGALGSFLLIGLFGAGGAVFPVAIIASTGAFALGARRGAPVLAVLSLAIIFTGPSFLEVRMSQYKGLEHALNYPGASHLRTYESGFSRVDVFESPAVRFAPGLNINYLDPLPKQIGITVDGSGLNAITDTSGNALVFLEHLPSALPYEMGHKGRVLSAEPGGGLPVLMAKWYDAKEVVSIESNPLVVMALREDFGSFSGDIYSVNTFSGLARSRLQSMDRGFDIIDLSLMGSSPYGIFGAAEDYRMTVEAFRTYLNSLSPHGMLSISLYLIPPPRTELRVLTTAIESLREEGIQSPEKHVAAIRSFATITVVVKRTQLSLDEITRIKEFSSANGFDLVYYPGIVPSETNIHIQMPEDIYFNTYSSLLSQERDEFIRHYLFDIRPVRDNRPFFHYFLKAGTYREAYRLLSGKWQFFLEEGWLQPAVFIQAALLSLMLLVLPVFFSTSRDLTPSPLLVYFALIGLGFMFVEVPLIQKLILPLENPSYAFATVLCSLLISSGAGSILGQRLVPLASPRIVLVLSLTVITYGQLFLYLSGSLTSLTPSLRLTASFVFIMPMGFLMGLPFPMGIRTLGRNNPNLIPWAWAVNGCFSVLAPLLATMSAMVTGFRVVFLAGAVMYAFAYLFIRKAV